MAETAPAFDPSEPYEPVQDNAPAFDPAKPYETVEPPSAPAAQPAYMPGLPAQAPAPGPSLWQQVTGAYKEGFGDTPVGMSQQDVEWMIDHGIFRKDDALDSPLGIARAFAETFIYGGEGAAATAVRTVQGLYRAGQAALVGLGVPRDIVSLPEAFPIDIPGTVAHVLEEPQVADAIVNGPVDRAGHVPYEAGASMGADTTTHIDKSIPPIAELPSGAKFDTTIPLKIHEQTEKFVMDKLIAGGMDNAAAYKVAHWDFAEPAEDAWYRAQGIDPAEAEKWWEERAAHIEHEPTADTPPDLYDKPYPHDSISLARTESDVATPRPSAQESARAMDIMRAAVAPVDLTEAHELGVVGEPRPSLENGTPAQAAGAAVPSRVMAAQRTGDDVLRGPSPSAAIDRAGNIRLDLIGLHADAKSVIEDAAKANDDFMVARRGGVPLAQVESLSEASGIPAKTLSANDGLGRLMHNDAVVRTWLQAFIQASQDVAAAMQQAKMTRAPDDLAALDQKLLRFSHMQEQVSGLTAEAGRTLAVFREFYAAKQGAQAIGGFVKRYTDNPDRSMEDLQRLADAGAGLPPDKVAKLVQNARTPTFWDKYLFYWVNALISGPVTHAKYIGANAAFAAYEATAVTPLAGAVGTARRALTGATGGVYAGETAARLWGLLAGTPDALRAAWHAARDNIQTPLPGEVAKNVNPVINQRPNPIGGVPGTIVGLPSRGAAGIHSFFNFLGYRAEIEAQAYRAAAKEGLSLSDDAFWRRREEFAANPTTEMMDAGIQNAYRLSFIEEQGEFGKAMSRLLNTRLPLPGGGEWQPLKLIVPFVHIPGNIMRAGLRNSPFGPLIDGELRADLLGRNGTVAQDTAMGRLIAGGVVSGLVVNWALNDHVTGFGPTDPTERAIWLRSHQPYSVRLGNWWVSYDKFGPIGDLIGTIANLAEIGPKVADGQYSEAAGRIVKASGRLVEDEVGMQGLANLIEAIDQPDGKMARFLASQAASNLPYSSLLRQGASEVDPYMREAKTFVDALRYNIPYARQDLLPKRDGITGEPLANPGYMTLLRQHAVSTDPLDAELAQLVLKPGPPQDRIGGVKLTPALYDQYQAIAGALVKTSLDSMVRSPGWTSLAPYLRREAIQRMIEGARQTAAAAMQARHPELIRAGIQQVEDYIRGTSHTRRPKAAPASLDVQP